MAVMNYNGTLYVIDDEKIEEVKRSIAAGASTASAIWLDMPDSEGEVHSILISNGVPITIGTPDRTPDTDFAIEFLARTINQLGERDPEKAAQGVPVTVSVDGLMVSGRVIPAVQYWNEFEEYSKYGIGRGMAELLQDSPSDRLPRWLHLKNTRFWQYPPNPIPTDEIGIYWRVRIADVHGWTLGTIGSGEPPTR